MQHANVKILEQLYANFAKGDMGAVLAACAENVTFQIAGKSRIAGKYTKENFASQFVTKLKELSSGTFKLEVHDILANDRHAVALVSEFVTRNGEEVQMRMAHVWRMEHGKPVAWYAYPRDLYQFDAAWS